MAGGKLELKARIRSIESTKKITKAMQLVAASKLKKQRLLMEENKTYAYYMKDTMEKILSSIESTNPYVSTNKGKPYTIIITSDMGLCGGYNANIYRMISSLSEGEIALIGSRGSSWCKVKGLSIHQSIINLGDDAYDELVHFMDDVYLRYQRQEISEIRILYTQFVNAVTFEPKLVTLLPIQKEQASSSMQVQTIFEPSKEEMLEMLVPMYLRSLLYSYYLESKTSEQASRRLAMETATDNAQELKETLELQFNKARQAAITQEITEIVGGVNAMEGGS